jgi:hypothetical protein
MKSSVFCDITPCSLLEVRTFLEEHSLSIFSFKEQARQGNSMKQAVMNPIAQRDGWIYWTISAGTNPEET